MNEQNPKHKIMARIAKAASWLAWITLAISFINVLIIIPETFRYESLRASVGNTPTPQTFFDLFASPYTALDMIQSLVNRTISGVKAFLTLKAVSVGLFMLLDIDMNYSVLKNKNNEGLQDE